MSLDLRVRQGFISAGVPELLVDEVIASFSEAKKRFYRDDLRPTAIEGARFSEAVFRVLQWHTSQTFTPLGKTLPSVDELLVKFVNTTANDSVRMHIPRTLRLIYDIRNKRDIAHLGDGIDPNQQDATLVVRNMDWVLAELVRIYHGVSPSEAHGIIVDLVSKEIPIIQEFDGHPRILKQMKASDHFLSLLYWRGTQGATLEELRNWARPAMRSNIKRTLDSLDARDLVHLRTQVFVLTHLGEEHVEKRRLLDPT